MLTLLARLDEFEEYVPSVLEKPRDRAISFSAGELVPQNSASYFYEL